MRQTKLLRQVLGIDAAALESNSDRCSKMPSRKPLPSIKTDCALVAQQLVLSWLLRGEMCSGKSPTVLQPCASPRRSLIRCDTFGSDRDSGRRSRTKPMQPGPHIAEAKPCCRNTGRSTSDSAAVCCPTAACLCRRQSLSGCWAAHRSSASGIGLNCYWAARTWMYGCET